MVDKITDFLFLWQFFPEMFAFDSNIHTFVLYHYGGTPSFMLK